jgi:hypothetical protein
MAAAKAFQPAYSFVSGVHIRTPDPAHVDALATTVLRLAFDSPWIVDLFPLLEPAHWNAYAREAGVPNPDQPTRKAARQLIRARVSYQGLTPDPDDVAEDQ